MTELEKIAYAKSFIDKLANGINPIDDQPVAEYDVVNNVRLTRCFFYVSGILQKEIDRAREQNTEPLPQVETQINTLSPDQTQAFAEEKEKASL